MSEYFTNLMLLCNARGDGRTIHYETLISTVPLDALLAMPGVAPHATPAMSAGLIYSSTNVVLIGLRGVNPHDTKCWLYVFHFS